MKEKKKKKAVIYNPLQFLTDKSKVFCFQNLRIFNKDEVGVPRDT